MVRDKSKASEKQNPVECNDTNEDTNIEKEDNPIVSRDEADDDDGKLDAEKEESAEKESSKSEEIDGALVVASEGESEVDEVWDITRVIPTAEEKIECRYEHCSAHAVATWATNTNPEDKWSLCEKCQFEDFGGWPEGVQPIERSNDEKVIAVPPTLTTAIGDDAAPNSIATICKTPPRSYSTKNKVGASFPMATDEPIITQDDSDEASEEKYELSSIVSLEKLRANPVKCSDENCTLPACSVWTSTTDPKKWYYCVDCQEKDFGGWPTSNELPCDHLSSEHLIAIATKCSKKRKPVMPVFASKCVTPNPSLSPKGRTAIPGGGKGGKKPPTVKVSRAAVARHEKWQADAKKMGVNRIIVKKNEAKKVIFDALYDSFRPMSSENIYMMLKKMVPQPVVNAAVHDMSMKDDHVFGASDDDDEDNAGGSTKEKKSQKKEAYAGSLFFKAGRSASSSLYYVDHNKIKEMSFDEKRELSEKVANANAEQDQLTFVLKELHTKTTQLLGQPTNHVLTERLGELENEVETLAKEVNDAKALTVNESHKKKLKRRIQSMAGHYRKRKQLCCSFLSSLEEVSDGTISKKKCLKGDGPIALDSDETVNKAAIAYYHAKSKKRFKTKSGSLADENFVGVALDSQKMIKRVYVNED